MKNFLYLTLFFFAITLSLSAQKIDSKELIYNDGVSFKIKRFNNSKTTQYGDGNDFTLYIAKGGRFKSAWLEFSNTTAEDQEIDFGKIFLLDSNGEKYHIHIVAQAYRAAFTTENYKLNLKAGKTRLYIIEFWPPYPKDEKVEKIEVDGNIFVIE